MFKNLKAYWFVRIILFGVLLGGLVTCYDPSDPDDQNGTVFGEGGWITLVNGTDSDWIKFFQEAHPMNYWYFPDTITAGSSISVYVEWGQYMGHSADGTRAEVNYGLDGSPDLSFQIQANAKDDFDLTVVLTNLETMGNSKGSV